MCSELFYQFVECDGVEIHNGAHLFSLFGQDFSNSVKDSCIICINMCSCMLFAEILDASVQFLVTWTCDILGLSDVWGASELSFAWLGVFVK
jgi:hypothetical protein